MIRKDFASTTRRIFVCAKETVIVGLRAFVMRGRINPTAVILAYLKENVSEAIRRISVISFVFVLLAIEVAVANSI
jgi:hypothetical protein